MEIKTVAKKKKKINRSQAIRDFLAKDPSAMPKAIKAARAKKGIDVSNSLVNAIKYGQPKKGPGKRVRKTGSRSKSTSGETSFDALLGAKALADKLGGVQRAQQALGMLERLA